ncbi:phospholipase D-like domain-containing protein [Parvibaculum sp.]|uniref:phospholipase D-like domain-containing protein n=1 Tax=Parvibaculum sp. TaxID=2024848 RepID=UPI003BA9B969
MKTTFLTQSEITTAIRNLTKRRDKLKVAVAFWGTKSVRETGIDVRQSDSTIIICDLFSGACDPKEIRELLNVGVEVRTLDGMHAKVWLCGNFLLVGSANASANGLAFGQSTTSKNVEAGILIESPSSSKKALEWFEQLSRRSLIVDENMICEAEELWNYNRQNGLRLSTSSLIGRLQDKNYNASIKNARLVVYRPEELSKESKRTFEKNVKGKAAYSENDLRYGPPYYEDDSNWDVAPGTVILDFQAAARKVIEYGGIWQIRSDPFINVPLPDAPKNRMILCDHKFGLGDVRFPKSDQEQLIKLLRAYLHENGWTENSDGNLLDQPLIEFWNFYGPK